MEHNGDVYSCDHFVFPEYKLGDIRDHSLIDMLYGEQQHEFSRLKRKFYFPASARSVTWSLPVVESQRTAS